MPYMGDSEAEDENSLPGNVWRHVNALAPLPDSRTKPIACGTSPFLKLNDVFSSAWALGDSVVSCEAVSSKR